jgi:hypothetical protein
VAGRPEDVHGAAGDFQGEEDVDPFEGDRAVDGKRSTASMVEAWARRNRRQDVSVDRSGAGGMRRSLRILRIVDAPTRWPSLRISPWMRW